METAKNLLDWTARHWMDLGMGLLVAWLLWSQLGMWLTPAEKDDPNSPLIHLDSANFDKEVLGSDKPVLVDFWAPWCMPCRVQGPIVSALAVSLAGKARVGKVNVQVDPTLAGRFGIAGIPTLLVFRQGRVDRRFTGLTSEAELKKALN